jgi:hypothetical protein
MAQAKLTAADLEEYLAPLDLKVSTNLNHTARQSYRAAAAVLAAITDPGSLKPFAGDGSVNQSADPAQVLGADLVPNPAKKSLGGSLMLSFDIRREALRKLGTRERMLQALDANPQERVGSVQQKLEQYIRGEALPLEQQRGDELEESLQAILWLEGLGLPGVPAAEEARRTLARAQLLRPFERIAGDHFRGRVSELDRLRTFVGVLPPHLTLTKLRSAAAFLLGIAMKPVMSLYGPGGIGKTALVMRFCLEHLRLPEEQRVPFAYLDFDSPFLNINDLSTVATEMVRQLTIQFPGFNTPQIPSDPEGVANALSEVLGQLSVRAQQPYLIVLDTFEEVQYGGESRASLLWVMLTNLQRSWPFLRVLVSGRAPVQYFSLGGSKSEEFELGGLDDEAAKAIVMSAGISSPDVAAALVKQVGRVPLSLRLAASVVQKEGQESGKVRNLQTSEYLFFKISDEVIQGQLYGRILEHIHTKEVARLAHPGLVLRCITPDVILKVLKGPCQLSVTSLEEATALYQELAKETALVAEENGQILRHRQDLRRTMLDLLLEKNPAQANEINHLAIDYYAAQTAPEAKAEEIYHRLMIGAPPWQSIIGSFESLLRSPLVRASLSRSLSELPVSAQILLASYGYDVDPDVLKRATKTEREAHIEARVAELLRHGPSGVPAADKEIKTASYRGSNSRLYLAESRVLLMQNRFAEAITLVDEGLALASSCHHTSRIVDLLAMKCWLLEKSARWPDLSEPLRYLEDYSSRLQRPLPLIQVWAQRFRLARIQTDPVAENAAAVQLAPLLIAQPIEQLASIAAMLSVVFERLGAIDPEVANRAIELGRFAPGGLAPIEQMLAKWPYLPYLPIVQEYA